MWSHGQYQSLLRTQLPLCVVTWPTPIPPQDTATSVCGHMANTNPSSGHSYLCVWSHGQHQSLLRTPLPLCVVTWPTPIPPQDTATSVCGHMANTNPSSGHSYLSWPTPIPPHDKAPHSQKTWDTPKLDCSHVRQSICVSRKESSAWLHAVPNSSLA